MAHGVHWMFMSQEKMVCWVTSSVCTGLHTMRPVHKASTLHRHRSPLSVNVAIKHITTRYTVTSTHQWSVFIADVTRYTRKSLHVIKKRIWWWHNSFTKPLDVSISHLNRQHQITYRHDLTQFNIWKMSCTWMYRQLKVHFSSFQTASKVQTLNEPVLMLSPSCDKSSFRWRVWSAAQTSEQSRTINSTQQTTTLNTPSAAVFSASCVFNQELSKLHLTLSWWQQSELTNTDAIQITAHCTTVTYDSSCLNLSKRLFQTIRD